MEWGVAHRCVTSVGECRRPPHRGRECDSLPGNDHFM